MEMLSSKNAFSIFCVCLQCNITYWQKMALYDRHSVFYSECSQIVAMLRKKGKLLLHFKGITKQRKKQQGGIRCTLKHHQHWCADDVRRKICPGGKKWKCRYLVGSSQTASSEDIERKGGDFFWYFLTLWIDVSIYKSIFIGQLRFVSLFNKLFVVLCRRISPHLPQHVFTSRK